MINKANVSISFEFFPPRNDEQKLVLDSTWQKLSRLNPRYLSVTFGAGGSTLDATLQTVTETGCTKILTLNEIHQLIK